MQIKKYEKESIVHYEKNSTKGMRLEWEMPIFIHCSIMHCFY